MTPPPGRSTRLSDGSAYVGITSNRLNVEISGGSLPAGTNNIGDVDVLSLPATPAGNNNIGDVDIASIAAGNNNIGDVDIASIATGTNTIGGAIPKPDDLGRLSLFRSLDLDESEEDVKASAGQLYGWYIYNDAATEVYVKIYNLAAASVTVGSTTPVMTIPIPASSAANAFNVHGIAFSTAICAAATTGVDGRRHRGARGEQLRGQLLLQLMGSLAALGVGGATVSNFVPTDIAGLQLWLRADDIAQSDNTAVSAWADQSGSGNNAAQATGGLQPTYQTSEVNGHSVVRFDGTDDVMGVAGITNNDATRTIFWAGKIIAPPSTIGSGHGLGPLPSI